MSIIRWVDKENVVYLENGIFSHKKKGNSAICNNTDDGPYMWILKTKLIDAENRLVVARGWG